MLPKGKFVLTEEYRRRIQKNTETKPQNKHYISQIKRHILCVFAKSLAQSFYSHRHNKIVKCFNMLKYINNFFKESNLLIISF